MVSFGSGSHFADTSATSVHTSVTGPNRTALSGYNRTTEENRPLFIYHCIISNISNKHNRYDYLLSTAAPTKCLQQVKP
jgi:hypothetical protein